MDKIYYKVLKPDLTNLGLLNAPTYQYKEDDWNHPLDGVSNDKMKGGGLWVCDTPGKARALVKYMRKKHNIDAIIKACAIGEIIHETSTRIKTDKLKFLPDK